jgi:hypothetical protein
VSALWLAQCADYLGGGSGVDSVSLILAALVTGVATGLATGPGESGAKALRDAYKGLRDTLRRRLAGKLAAEDAVEQYTRDPETWKSNLEIHLRQAGADQDQAVLDAASLVLRLADPAGATEGKYSVNLARAQGVQVGDHNTQTNTFGAPA